MRAIVILLGLVMLSAGIADAEVRIDRTTRTTTGAVPGNPAGISTQMSRSVIVKGDRMMTVETTVAGTSQFETRELVDLQAQKIYRLDMRRRTYTEETFAELRSAARDFGSQPQAPPSPEEIAAMTARAQAFMAGVQSSRQATGQRRTILGFEAREVVETLRMPSIEGQPGMLIATTEWIVPEIQALSEIDAFEKRHREMLGQAPMVPAQLAAAGFGPAMPSSNSPGAGDAQGTTVLQTTSTGAAEDGSAVADAKPDSRRSRFGAIGGAIGRRALGIPGGAEAPASMNTPTRSTTEDEIVRISTSVSDDEVSIPTGFKLERARR